MGDPTTYPPINPQMEKLLVVLTGPTCVGKTAVAIKTATHYRTEIISCDSRQMYREMRIGTAVPTPEQLATIPHHFIGNISIHDYYNVSMFEVEALALLDRLFQTHNIVVVTGGSGLYLNALCRGIDDFPTVNHSVRESVTELFKIEGMEGLRNRLYHLDPVQYGQMDNLNKQRVMKALEICLQTGKPYSSFLSGTRKPRPFNILYIGLDSDRDLLYQSINLRVDSMIQEGLVEEAKTLYPYRDLNALKTVGYRELFDYMEGICSLREAIELIKRNTRHYAKRQLTWFRGYPEMTWFRPDQPDEIIRHIDSFRPSASPAQ